MNEIHSEASEKKLSISMIHGVYRDGRLKTKLERDSSKLEAKTPVIGGNLTKFRNFLTSYTWEESRLSWNRETSITKPSIGWWTLENSKTGEAIGESHLGDGVGIVFTGSNDGFLGAKYFVEGSSFRDTEYLKRRLHRHIERRRIVGARTSSRRRASPPRR